MRDGFRRTGLALLIVLTGCTTDFHADMFGLGDTPNIVLGRVLLAGSNADASDGEPRGCAGDDAHVGFGAGMEVVIFDQHGALVAESRTREAFLQSFVRGAPDESEFCVAPFVLKDVAYHSDTYTIAAGELGSAAYAARSYSGEELPETRREVVLVVDSTGQ